MPGNSIPLLTLDTNVFVSGTTISSRPTSQIIQAWEKREIQIAMSEPILLEVKEVLSRPHFISRLNWDEARLNNYVTNLRNNAIIVPGTTEVDICQDPDDNIVFSCALEARADYIISHDKSVLAVIKFEGIPAIRPKEFVDKFLNSRTD